MRTAEHHGTQAGMRQGRVVAAEIGVQAPPVGEAVEDGDQPAVEAQADQAQQAMRQQHGRGVAVERAHGGIGQHAGLAALAQRAACRANRPSSSPGRLSAVGFDPFAMPSLAARRP